MEGPNPFISLEEDAKNIYGRKEEAKIFNDFVNMVSSMQGTGILITGGLGMGKTALLRHFKYIAEKNGLLVPYVKIERGEKLNDIIEKLGTEFSLLLNSEQKINHEKLETMLDGIKTFGNFGAVIFLDEIDQVKEHDRLIEEIVSILKKYWGKRKLGFVMSSVKELEYPEIIKKMVLDAFSEHDAHDFVTSALSRDKKSLKMGEECLHSIMIDSNGNPKIVNEICRYMYSRIRENEKIISKGHYLAYLPHILSMFSREWFGKIYQETPEAEMNIVRVIAKNNDGVHVSKIAKELGKPIGQITVLIKRLLGRGQIIKMERGKYRIFARLYGKYVLSRG